MKNLKTKSKRAVSLALTARAEDVLARTKSETGITIVALLERLLEWYAAQDPRIRAMILSPYCEVRQGLARLVLQEMAAHPRREFDTGLRFDALIDNDFDTKPSPKGKHSPVRRG